MNTNLNERVSVNNDVDTHQYERAEQASLFQGPSKLKKSHHKADLEITNRDIEIIEFLIEMKFASAGEVFSKFFKITRNGETACSTEWAKKRLKQLEKHKFIKSVYSFSDSTRFFVATLKGYYALSALCPEKEICKPVGGFDIRTFAHDRRVLDARIFLEQKESISGWLSERKLKSTPRLCQGLSSQYIPDAIYKTKNGESVAFELEIAAKAKSRYRDKIQRYLSLLRSQKVDKPFERVEYVCAKEGVFNLLKQETKIYGDLFSVKRLDEYFAS